MTTILSNFGFRFSFNGKEYGFQLSAESKEDALRKFDALKDAEFLGEVYVEEMSLPNVKGVGPATGAAHRNFENS